MFIKYNLYILLIKYSVKTTHKQKMKTKTNETNPNGKLENTQQKLKVGQRMRIAQSYGGGFCTLLELASESTGIWLVGVKGGTKYLNEYDMEENDNNVRDDNYCDNPYCLKQNCDKHGVKK